MAGLKILDDLCGISRRVIGGGPVTRSEVRQMLDLSGEAIHDLLYWAHKIRHHFHGNRVTFCSIVASKFGDCSEDCKYCAQSVHYETDASARPMMSADEVVSAVRDAKANGAGAFGIVNQGFGPAHHDWELVLEAVRQKDEIDGVCNCASLGILRDDQAADLKAAGLRRYNHNLETSKEHFGNICTTHTWQQRYDTIRLVKEMGMEVCSGGIFGMDESVEDRVSLLFSIKELNPHVVPLNFLFPIAGTPLENAEPLAPLEILKIIAAARFVLPHQDIKVAGGREKNLRDLQSWIFYAGATSMLVGNYLATYGRPAGQDLKMIEDLGLEWVQEVGGPDPNAPEPETSLDGQPHRFPRLPVVQM